MAIRIAGGLMGGAGQQSGRIRADSRTDQVPFVRRFARCEPSGLMTFPASQTARRSATWSAKGASDGRG
jgi:hypothetical protein